MATSSADEVQRSLQDAHVFISMCVTVSTCGSGVQPQRALSVSPEITTFSERHLLNQFRQGWLDRGLSDPEGAAAATATCPFVYCPATSARARAATSPCATS